MSRRLTWALAGLAVAVLVVGAFGLRAQLRASFPGVPLLRWPAQTPAQPTSTPTPAARVWVTTPGPGASPTGRLEPSAPAAAPPSGTAGPGSSIWLPFVQQGRTEPPFPLDTRLTPEAQPTPVPTPVPPTPVPTPAITPSPEATRCPMRVTKLGIGLYDSGGAYLPVLDQLRPSVILLMDPKPDFAVEVRKRFPQAFIVGRIYDKDQPLDNPAARGVEFADRVAQLAVPLKGVVDAWMSYNEITGHKDYNNYRAYNEFQVAFANRLQGTYGVDAVAGNDGTGTVDPADYAKYFAEAIRASKYFGIHSYAPKGEQTMRDPRSHYLTLRHREIRDALVAAGIPVRKNQFIITEAGLWDGWRGFVSEESMAQDFTWFADELAKDDYVLGATIFGLFANDRWQGFNIAGTGIIQRIGNYNTQCP